jgi:hypothetical protein
VAVQERPAGPLRLQLDQPREGIPVTVWMGESRGLIAVGEVQASVLRRDEFLGRSETDGETRMRQIKGGGAWSERD